MRIHINLTSLPAVIFTALFIGLKLTGYISWPWLWVLAPLWGPLALLIILGILLLLVSAVVTLFKR